MSEHELKTWPEPFSAVLSGTKRHEIRKADRPFAVGDVLELREWDPDGVPVTETIRVLRGQTTKPQRGKYTGRSIRVRVTYLSAGGTWGLPNNLCVMSIEVLP